MRFTFLISLFLVVLFATEARSAILVASYASDQILRYDESDGSFLGVFASGSGLDGPVGMTFGPDGNVYVAAEPLGSVFRFNGVSGAFIDQFVAPGSGGLQSAHDVRFGPDGHLYVSSQIDHAVFRFDGSTGAFIDQFVSAGSG